MDTYSSYTDMFYEFSGFTYPCGIPDYAPRSHSDSLRSLQISKVPSPRPKLGFRTCTNVCSWGVFRMTDPPGVKTITDCRERSLFHLHTIPGDAIYRDCWRGTSDGHVREMPGAKLEVVDLRK